MWPTGDTKIRECPPLFGGWEPTVGDAFDSFTKLLFTELLPCIGYHTKHVIFISNVSGFVFYKEIEAKKSEETYLQSQSWNVAIGIWVCGENAKDGFWSARHRVLLGFSRPV